MAERDAFGNKKGDDDSLADMGWSLGGGNVSIPGSTPTPAPVPASAAAPVPVRAPTGVPSSATVPPAPVMTATSTSPGTSPSGLPSGFTVPNIPGSGIGTGMIGRFVGILIAVAVIGGIAAAVISGVSSVSDKVRSVTNSFSVPSFTTSTSGTSEKPATPSSPPVGLKRGSMLRADRFGPALVRLRAQGSRAQTVRIDAERVTANVLDQTGRMSVVSLAWNGDRQVVQTPAHIPASTAVSLRDVSSKAPSRAVARAAGALGRPARQVNYIVLTNFAGTAKWFVYFKDGRYLSASLDGRHVQRIG